LNANSARSLDLLSGFRLQLIIKMLIVYCGLLEKVKSPDYK